MQRKEEGTPCAGGGRRRPAATGCVAAACGMAARADRPFADPRSPCRGRDLRVTFADPASGPSRENRVAGVTFA